MTILPSDLSPEMHDIRSKLIAALKNTPVERFNTDAFHITDFLREQLTENEHQTWVEFMGETDQDEFNEWAQNLVAAAGYELNIGTENYKFEDGCQSFMVVCDCNKSHELLEVAKGYIGTLDMELTNQVSDTLVLVDVRIPETTESKPAFMFEIQETDDQISAFNELKKHAGTDKRIKSVILGNRQKRTAPPSVIQFNE